MMHLTVLGRSGSFPAAGGACSGYLLQIDGLNVLIDCGAGVLGRLQQFVPLARVDAIVLSHLHYDHISDLFSLRYAVETLRALGREVAPIPLFLPATPASLVVELTEGTIFAPHIVADGTEVDFRTLRLRFDHMPHLLESHAVTVVHEGEKFVFSGDTGWNERLAEVVRNADLFLCEATFAHNGDALASDHHLAAEDAGRIAAIGKVKRLLLTHLSPLVEEATLLDAARRFFSRVEVVQEGMTYIVRKQEKRQSAT